MSEEIIPDYSKVNTKQLLKWLRVYTAYRDDEDNELPNKDHIRAELAKRGHINNKAQSLLVRQMSKKAGKKLTLREAQLMKNKETK